MGTDITLTEQTILDVAHFNDEVVGGYNMGTAEKALPADLDTAQPRSRRHRGVPRLQLHCSGYPRVRYREVCRLYGVRHRVSGHGNPWQGHSHRAARGEARHNS